MDLDLAYWGERIGPVLLAGAIVALLVQRLPKLFRAPAVVAITIAAAALPYDGRTVVDLLFSYTGPLSAASFLLLAWWIWRCVRWRMPGGWRPYGFGVMAAMLLGLAFLLYPPTLGVGPLDPYRYGFGGWQLPALLLVLAGIGFVLRAWVVAIWLGLSAGLFLSGLQPSLNLWDSLIDPLAALFAVFVLPASLFAGLFRRRAVAATAEA
jgi:hypothetical protein